MDILYPLLIQADDAGPHGEKLECTEPIKWPGLSGVDLNYVKTLASRLLAASYRAPDLLSMFAMRKTHLIKLVVHAKQIFSREHNIVDIVVPHEGQVRVFGDVHGDFHSLMEALNLAGLPSESNILVFAGDCVDRGCWGVEVLSLIFALKIYAPSYIFLIRGNHETTGCTNRYGFANEVRRKYDKNTFDNFCKSFRELPVAALLRVVPSSGSIEEAATAAPALVSRKSRRAKRMFSSQSIIPGQEWRGGAVAGENRILVVHGGLFRSWKSRKRCEMAIGDLSDLADTNRREEDPYECIIEDVIWSDPWSSKSVASNTLRGAGILYGTGAVQSFFKKNDLKGMIRAHEGPDMREQREEMGSVQDGYCIDMEVAEGYVVTIFSAADYPPDKPRGNKGAFATLHGKGCVSGQVLPEFCSFEKRDAPGDMELFYTSENKDESATPRNSVCED